MLEHRLKHFVPVKVPSFDAQSTIAGEVAAARTLAEEFAEELDQYQSEIDQYLADLLAYNEAMQNGDPNPPPLPEPPEAPDAPVLENPEVQYKWVTRPEMHFSILDLKVNEIKLQTNTAGTLAEVDYDLTQKGGQSPIPALERTDGVEDEQGRLQRELLFMLGGYGTLAEIADGGDGETVAILKDLGQQLDLVPASQLELLEGILEKLKPEDFLILQLVQSDDAANGLFEFAGLPLIIVPRFTPYPNYNLLPDPLRLKEYAGNPDYKQLLDRRLKVPPIKLTRTTHLGCFNDKVCNAGELDITDSFQLFPIRVTQAIDLKIELIDAQTELVAGTLIEQDNLPPGAWNFILTYEDIAQHNIGHRLAKDFELKITATLAGAANDPGALQLSQEILHPGDLEELFDNAILGNILQHEVLIQRGQLSLRREDMSLKGRGPRLTFNRSYTNQAQRNPKALMGQGWNHNHGIVLQIDGYGDEPVENNIPQWVDDARGQLFRGSRIRDFERPYLISVSNAGQFKRVGEDWQSMRSFHGTLTEVDDGYEFLSKDGTLYFFNKPKRRWVSDLNQSLESGATPNLAPTRVSYADSLYSRLFITTDPVEQSLLDPLTSITNKPVLLDPNVRFGPSEPAPVRFIQDRNGNRMTYAYAEENEGERLVSIADAVGRGLSFEYKDFEIEQQSPDSGPESDQFPDVVDGKRIRGQLDYEENRIAIQEPPPQAAPDEELPPLKLTRLHRVTGPDGIELNFAYARYGDDYLADQFARGQFKESYSYQTEQTSPESYNLNQVTDANGHSIDYSYKEPGEIGSGILQYVKALDQEDLIDTVKYPDGKSAQFDYHHAQNHRTYTDLRGFVTTYELNNFGQPTAIREPLNKTTRMTWTIDEGANDAVMSSRTDAEGRKTEYEYDTQGNITRETDPYNKVTVSGWNQDFSLLESRTDRNGNSIGFSINEANGNLERETDAEGKITTHTYNDFGERETTKDPRGNTTGFSYDDYGNLET
ncbi:MAG: RHS repeat protein, partial [Gammaproteobacteria bacterium]|nr:RHS repeat protein [Gammaproteobacteria bacterium]